MTIYSSDDNLKNQIDLLRSERYSHIRWLSALFTINQPFVVIAIINFYIAHTPEIQISFAVLTTHALITDMQ